MDKLDKVKYIKRVIIVSWIALAICLAIKIFGGNLFEIVCTNKNFIAICNYCDTHIWAEYLICAIYSLLSLYFFTLAVLARPKYKTWELIIVIATILVGTGIKIWNAQVGFVFDVWQGFIMPIIFIGKDYKQYWRVLLANVLLMVFQLISMFVKDASFDDIYNNSVIGSIFAIDVVIMIILYMCYAVLYKNKKEVKGNE